MEHIPENIKVVARFILLALQRTLADIHMGEHLEQRDHQERYNESFLTNANTDIQFSKAAQQRLHQGLTTMAYHLPVVLLNAGLTKTLIPASRIYCQLQNNLLGIYVQEVGTFILDIQFGRMVTFMWPTVAENKPHTPPATDSLSRYRLSTAPDVDGHIGWLKDKATDAVQDKIKEFTNAPADANLLQFRKGIKHFSGAHDIYKGLFKERDLVKGVPAGNTGEIMGNDKFKEADLENINRTQQATPEQGGGYGPLTRMLDAYNRYWGAQFAGLYLAEDAFQQSWRSKTVPGSLTRNYTNNFDPHPKDASGQPYQYFIYMHVEGVKSGDIDLQKTGVIRVNPKD